MRTSRALKNYSINGAVSVSDLNSIGPGISVMTGRDEFAIGLFMNLDELVRLRL